MCIGFPGLRRLLSIPSVDGPGLGPDLSQPMRMHCGMFVGTMGVLRGRMEIWSFRQSACPMKEVFTQNCWNRAKWEQREEHNLSPEMS